MVASDLDDEDSSGDSTGTTDESDNDLQADFDSFSGCSKLICPPVLSFCVIPLLNLSSCHNLV